MMIGQEASDMFVYVTNDKLRNELINDGHTLLYEGSNEKGGFWCFEVSGNFDFSSYFETQDFTVSKKMFF